MHVQPVTCPVCGIELPSSDRGRPRTYCSRACRYRAAYMRDSEQVIRELRNLREEMEARSRMLRQDTVIRREH